MPIVFTKTKAVFSNVADPGEAEALLEWLQKYPKGKIDLGACTHLHPAVLQVIMAAQRTPSVQPTDEKLAIWLASALKPV